MSLLTNPFFNIGMGLLNRSGPSLTPVNPWMGISDGLMSVQRGRLYEQEAAAREMQAQQAQREMERQARLDQWAASQSDPMAQMFPEAFAEQAIKSRFTAPTGSAEMVTAGALGLTGLPAETPVEVKRDATGAITDYSVVSVPQQSAPSDVQEYEYARAQGYQGTFADYQSEMRRAGATSVNVQMDKPLSATELQKLRLPDGSIPPPGTSMGQAAEMGATIAPTPLTEDQSKGTMFYQRASQMDEALAASNYDATGFRGAWDRATTGGTATNWAASDEGQAYINQGRNFVASVLRKESGATITESEWEQGQQMYIPMPGDSPATIEQKARNRQLAVEGLKVSAGEGVQRLPAQKPAESGGWSIQPVGD